MSEIEDGKPLQSISHTYYLESNAIKGIFLKAIFEAIQSREDKYVEKHGESRRISASVIAKNYVDKKLIEFFKTDEEKNDQEV